MPNAASKFYALYRSDYETADFKSIVKRSMQSSCLFYTLRIVTLRSTAFTFSVTATLRTARVRICRKKINLRVI